MSKKKTTVENEIVREKALLVGLVRNPKERWHRIERLEELELLTETAGAQVFEKILQVKEPPDPATFIGKGKAKEINEIIESYGVDTVIFDTELSASQSRNLKKIIGSKVIDRTELILDIFAQHAKTSEAKIQVELAQLLYRLPRLTGKGIALSRLGGGIGTRGPGEKKLEVDRRRILDRINLLKKQLERLDLVRTVQRKKRKKVLKVALVGYTNTGKSSVMNALTKAKVYVADQLFATLDDTTRVLYLSDFRERVILSDTIGFIEDLPLDLVASFRATLAVVKDADLLLHIIDVSHERLEDRINTVLGVLDDMGCHTKPILHVFNKIDLLLDREITERLKERYTPSHFISAKTGEGIPKLKEKIAEILKGIVEGTTSVSK